MGETQWTTTCSGSGLTGAYLRNKRFSLLSEPPAPWLTPAVWSQSVTKCHHPSQQARGADWGRSRRKSGWFVLCCCSSLAVSGIMGCKLSGLLHLPHCCVMPSGQIHAAVFARLAASFWDCYFTLGTPVISTSSSLHHLEPNFLISMCKAHVQKHNMWPAS